MVSSIEAPFALLQKPVKVLWLDAIKATQMTLRLVPKVFDAVDVVLSIGEELRVIDAPMMKIRNVQRIVRSERVGIDDAVGRHFFFDDRQHRFSLGVRHDGRKDLAATLQKAENGHFSSRTSAALAFTRAAKVAFIGFDLAGQLITWLLTCYQLPQTHEEARGGLYIHARDFSGGPRRRSDDE